MYIQNCNYQTAGIKKIEIPVRLKDLDEGVIKYYIRDCISALKQNAIKIEHLKKYVDGTHQDIYDKVYEKNTSGNASNKIVENHAFEIVQFKEGFLLGDKKQFASKGKSNTDDITYLDKFLCDCDYYAKDLELRHNIYSTGIGTSFILPRADIFIEENGTYDTKVAYKTEDDGYNVRNNSPFIYEVVDSGSNAVVYSSCIGEKGLKDLFCFNISTRYDKLTKKPDEIVTIYTREGIYEYEYKNDILTRKADNYAYGELPMTEHSINSSRISPIEVVYDLLNCVNLLTSLDTNSVEDKVSQLLIFVNCDIGQHSIEDLYKNGVICLPPSKYGTISPDVKTISNDLKYTETNILIERVLTRLFDIVGVPLASASVSNGNNEAAYLGGGWTNASAIIKRDILYFEKSDREELRKEIKICKLNPNNPINEIEANDIEVKYNINQSNNLLVKTQAMQNLNDMKMPLEDILKAVPLFGDIHSVSVRWAENIEAQRKIEEELQEKTAQSVGNNTSNADLADSNRSNYIGKQKDQEDQIVKAEQAKSV